MPDTPVLLKWAAIAIVALLFILGIIIQVNIRTGDTHDADFELRKSMGLTNDAAQASPLDIAYGKMGSPVSGIRLEGMNEAMAINPSASSGRIVQMLRDPAGEVRARAVGMIAQHKIGGGAASLLPLLSDPDPAVRAEVSKAIQNVSDQPGIIYSLSAPLMSRDPSVVSEALKVWRAAAAKDKNAALNVITPLLSSDNPAILEAALTAISSALSNEEIRFLKGQLENIQYRYPNTPAASAAGSLLASSAPAPLPTP